MKVLVAVASRYGSTYEIGEQIAATLRAALFGRVEDVAVDLFRAENVHSVDGYDAVVIGSAVYMGRWLKSADEIVRRHAGPLAAVPTWLFSSGPIGRPLRPQEQSANTAELAELISPHEHRSFPGKLNRKRLRLRERLIVSMLRVPEGDYRDWHAIDSWAAAIGEALVAHTGVTLDAG